MVSLVSCREKNIFYGNIDENKYAGETLCLSKISNSDLNKYCEALDTYLLPGKAIYAYSSFT